MWLLGAGANAVMQYADSGEINSVNSVAAGWINAITMGQGWKGTIQEMVDNWQKSVRSRALPEEAMTGWNEGMTRLQQLAERLNRLDEQRGKYMTVSELKTEVFGIMQAFNRHIPPEERLRRYGEVRDQNGSEQQQKQMENALAELMSRYWILERGFLNGEYKLISESGNN